LRNSVLATGALVIGLFAATDSTACPGGSADGSALQQSGVSWMLAQGGSPGSGGTGATPSQPPPKPGVTGKAPHAETGSGRATPGSEPVTTPGVTAPMEDPSGKRVGGGGKGATEESNTGPREQRMGEKPTP
jgi:hypothetical protein